MDNKFYVLHSHVIILEETFKIYYPMVLILRWLVNVSILITAIVCHQDIHRDLTTMFCSIFAGCSILSTISFYLIRKAQILGIELKDAAANGNLEGALNFISNVLYHHRQKNDQ